MTDVQNRERLLHLSEVVLAELAHLSITDATLFEKPFTVQRVAQLGGSQTQSERVDAFAARFARLQDTLGDKLLPALLLALGQPPAPVIDTGSPSNV